MPNVVAETPRLVLRAITAGDLDAYAALNADPVVTRFMGGRVRTRAETAAEIMSVLYAYEEHGYSFWAVERKGDGAWLGRAGLLRQELDDEVTRRRPPSRSATTPSGASTSRG